MPIDNKEYMIDSFEKICNIVNDENIDTFSIDLMLWLYQYNSAISAIRKATPKATLGKSNWEIARASFTWINDGENEIKATVIIDSKTGEKTTIHKK